MSDDHGQSHIFGHHHSEDPPGGVEEPLDPASQSLADALKASFRVLKIVMFFIVIAYLFSGVTMVDQKKVVVLTRFGKQVGPPREPGLLIAAPYPFHEKIDVPTAPKTLLVDDFWVTLRDAEKNLDVSDLPARGGGLDPVADGALITGDKAIMHLHCQAQYHVNDANLYVKNVQDEETELILIETAIKNAAIAEAARVTADVIWKEAGTLVDTIKIRAQKTLDDLQSGISIDNVAADKSLYPRQTKNEFDAVSIAENKRRDLIQGAEAKRTMILNGVAGPAWKQLYEEIRRIDQVSEGSERDAVIEKIKSILETEAVGEAGGLIKLAQRDRNEIIDRARAEANTFKVLLEEYRKNPELVREQFRQEALEELYSQLDVSTWMLPPGQKELLLLLNKDAEQVRKIARTKRKMKIEGRD